MFNLFAVCTFLAHNLQHPVARPYRMEQLSDSDTVVRQSFLLIYLANQFLLNLDICYYRYKLFYRCAR